MKYGEIYIELTGHSELSSYFTYEFCSICFASYEGELFVVVGRILLSSQMPKKNDSVVMVGEVR